ncbi:hypothetical protein FACUT_14140 [Fusarium acutatum]|uniref:Apple domain-containing protein n=1 Tax=Fusarium acutatum TaxID=78861 RepID=A0A8H4JA30_9HYPO|nr:hypothetical protein FACUT_14140 [Fusarium acutatum]
MKISLLYISLALASAVSAQEACIEGKRITISPGYTVEYKCGKFRAGQSYNNIMNHEDCAAKCQVANVDVCTYHAVLKKCVVGDPNRGEGASEGATYMVRVPEEPEDPFAEEEEDPFKETCEEEKEGLSGKLGKCNAKLDKYNAMLDAALGKPSCGVDKWGRGYYKTIGGMSLADCKEACDADKKCLSYSGYTPEGVRNCYLYDKETAKVADNKYPGWAQSDIRCN